MSTIWRDAADQRGSRVARSRPVKRSPPGAGFLVLPAVVMGVLCGAFLIWFLMGAPEFTVTPWKDSPEAPVRAPVQAPQMANTSPMPALRTSSVSLEPAPAPALQRQVPVIPAPAIPAEDSMALALQPTPQISTPAAMRSVMSEPQQISVPEQEPRPPVAPQAAKRVTPPPAPPQPTPVAATQQPPKPTVAAAAAPATPDRAPPAEGEQPARRTFSIVLARVETEGEARAKLGPLKQKFGAMLGGRKLNYHRVKEDGVYIWRVRSPGLSEDDASEICEKIERAGGDCTASSQ